MTEPCLCLAVKSCSSEVSQHREGDSWFRNWDPNVHSPESWADLCLARGRLQTGNLESGHGLMPRTAEGEMLPDLTLKHQYWPEALGTLGQEEIPQRDSFGKDSLLLPGGMTRQPLREGAEEEASSGAKGRVFYLQRVDGHNYLKERKRQPRPVSSDERVAICL